MVLQYLNNLYSILHFFSRSQFIARGLFSYTVFILFSFLGILLLVARAVQGFAVTTACSLGFTNSFSLNFMLPHVLFLGPLIVITFNAHPLPVQLPSVGSTLPLYPLECAPYLTFE